MRRWAANLDICIVISFIPDGALVEMVCQSIDRQPQTDNGELVSRFYQKARADIKLRYIKPAVWAIFACSGYAASPNYCVQDIAISYQADRVLSNQFA